MFKPYLLSNGMSDWAKTWWEALGWHENSELLKTFCYHIHDGRQSSNLEALLLSVVYGQSLISMSIMLLFTFATSPSELYPWWPPWRSSWKSSVVICSWTVSHGAETWWKALGQHGDLELLKWFHSDILWGLARNWHLHFLNQRKEIMTVENISWSISMKEGYRLSGGRTHNYRITSWMCIKLSHWGPVAKINTALLSDILNDSPCMAFLNGLSV